MIGRHRHKWRDHDGHRPPDGLWGNPEQFRFVPFYCKCGEVGHIVRIPGSWAIVVAAPNDPVRDVQVVTARPLSGPPSFDAPELDDETMRQLVGGRDT